MIDVGVAQTIQYPRFCGDQCQLDGFHEGLHVRLSCPGSALEVFWLHWDDALEPLGMEHDQRWPGTMAWLHSLKRSRE